MEAIEAIGDDPVLPLWDGACLANIGMALLEHPPLGDGWMPAAAAEASQVVLLLIDGLGWNQLAARGDLAPTLYSSDGGPITTVAPSTTATALTSFTTGVGPGQHGLVGYRILTAGESLNTLRWMTESGDARLRIPPNDVVQTRPFNGRQPPVITRQEFARSGFTQAHLDGTDFRGYGAISTMFFEIERAVAEGHRFTYAYYDGLDRVGHERGHGIEFDREYAYVDWMVTHLRTLLPDDVALLVTADHGQIDTADRQIELEADVKRQVRTTSGEARMLWLHAAGGHVDSLAELARAAHGDCAWVRTRDEAIDEGWFGPTMSTARERLGDVVLASRDDSAFVELAYPTPHLRGRHGSLTVDEMYVPLLSVGPV